MRDTIMSEKVKITKIAASPDPLAKTADSLNSYRENIENGDGSLSPSIDYWIIGRMVSPPEIGKSLLVFRENRNGVEMPGIFQTSPVEEIEGNWFSTANSVYMIEQMID